MDSMKNKMIFPIVDDLERVAFTATLASSKDSYAVAAYASVKADAALTNAYSDLESSMAYGYTNYEYKIAKIAELAKEAELARAASSAASFAVFCVTTSNSSKDFQK